MYVRGDRNPMKLLPVRILEELKKWLGLHTVGRRVTNLAGVFNDQG